MQENGMENVVPEHTLLLTDVGHASDQHGINSLKVHDELSLDVEVEDSAGVKELGAEALKPDCKNCFYGDNEKSTMVSGAEIESADHLSVCENLPMVSSSYQCSELGRHAESILNGLEFCDSDRSHAINSLKGSREQEMTKFELVGGHTLSDERLIHLGSRFATEAFVVVEAATKPQDRLSSQAVSDKFCRANKCGVEEQRQEAGVALWVKWRGKWQAGIQCFTVDCPAATLKAMPTYSRKTYIVVYFPSTRTYSWVDLQHVCPIFESPEPLASGTHDLGRKSVSDVDLPRRQILLRLGADMLDISDRLHTRAVVEASRNVSVWRAFAKEAAGARCYSEMGKLLVTLYHMILTVYIKPSWRDRRYRHWKDESEQAEDASSVEKLTKELINAVLWDEVAPLWPDQPDLDPEWEHWKGADFEKCSSSIVTTALHPVPEEPQSSLVWSGSKRFKEQARARRQKSCGSDTADMVQQKCCKVEANFLTCPLDSLDSSVGQTTHFPVIGPNQIQNGDALTVLSPTKSDTNWPSRSSEDLSLAIVVSPDETEFPKSFDITVKKGTSAASSEGLAHSSGLCSAFLKRKNRRCNRQAKERTTYCGKHGHLAVNMDNSLALDGNIAWESGLCSAFLRKENRRCARQARDDSFFCGFHVYLASDQESVKLAGTVSAAQEYPEVSGKIISSPLLELRCHGITTRGAQCTHRTKDGSPFCAKHSPRESLQVDGGDNSICGGLTLSVVSPSSLMECDQVVQEKPSFSHTDISLNLSHCRENIIPAVVEMVRSESFRKRKWVSERDSFLQSRFSVPSVHGLVGNEGDSVTANWTRCTGRTTRNDEQCSFKAKPGLAFCSKHLRIDTISGKTAIEESAHAEQGVSETPILTSGVSEATVLFSKCLESVDGMSIGDHGSDVQKQICKWAKVEAGKNLLVAKELLKLVTVELTRLQVTLYPMETTWIDDEQLQKEACSQASDLVGQHSNLLKPKPGLPVILDHSPEGYKTTVPLKCGLCSVTFQLHSDLCKHWKDCHRKEVSLFIKGFACRICGQLYTRKQTIIKHWRARHQSIPLQSPDLPVCLSCGLQFANFEDLLDHVVCRHADQLSGTKVREIVMKKRVHLLPMKHSDSSECNGKCCTPQDAKNCKNKSETEKCPESSSKSTMILSCDRVRCDPNNDVGFVCRPPKFGCRICGLKFALLPDLGRHHQAEHMKSKSVTLHTSPLMKTVDESSSRMKLPVRRKNDDKDLQSPFIAGDSILCTKNVKPLEEVQTCGLKRTGKEALLFRMKAALLTAQQRSLRNGKHRKGLSALMKWRRMLPTHAKEHKILAMARSVCCLSQLRGALEKKYSRLPDQMLANFFELSRDAGLSFQWQREGYVCSNGCDNRAVEVDCVDRGSRNPEDHSFSYSLLSNGFPETSIPDELLKGCDDLVYPTELDSQATKHIVLCPDLSGGQELEAVSCVIDEDFKTSLTENFHPWESFTYVTKRKLDPLLGLDTKSSQLGCSCADFQCSPKTCEHVYLFDNDNAEAVDIYGQLIRGRFPYDDRGCIILQEGYLVYECNSSCRCQRTCHNRVLQKGVCVKLEVFRTKYKGWAVRAGQAISRGTFVCEYIGEVLNDQEANKRGERYDQVGCSYLYDIDAHLDTSGASGHSKPFVIDATKYGNVSRFINHSCAPNLVNYQVLVESMDCQLAHIGLFACRDIPIGEELAYDYRYRLLPGKGCPCHCGAPNCRGRLY